jgi:hypothetical protein
MPVDDARLVPHVVTPFYISIIDLTPAFGLPIQVKRLRSCLFSWLQPHEVQLQASICRETRKIRPSLSLCEPVLHAAAQHHQAPRPIDSEQHTCSATVVVLRTSVSTTCHLLLGMQGARATAGAADQQMQQFQKVRCGCLGGAAAAAWYDVNLNCCLSCAGGPGCVLRSLRG